MRVAAIWAPGEARALTVGQLVSASGDEADRYASGVSYDLTHTLAANHFTMTVDSPQDDGGPPTVTIVNGTDADGTRLERFDGKRRQWTRSHLTQPGERSSVPLIGNVWVGADKESAGKTQRVRYRLWSSGTGRRAVTHMQLYELFDPVTVPLSETYGKGNVTVRILAAAETGRPDVLVADLPKSPMAGLRVEWFEPEPGAATLLDALQGPPGEVGAAMEIGNRGHNTYFKAPASEISIVSQNFPKFPNGR